MLMDVSEERNTSIFRPNGERSSEAGASVLDHLKDLRNEGLPVTWEAYMSNAQDYFTSRSLSRPDVDGMKYL
jgi:hypothetical protein